MENLKMTVRHEVD